MKDTRILGLWLLFFAVSSITFATTDISAVPDGYGKNSITQSLALAEPEGMMAYRLASMNAAFDMVDKAMKIAVENNEDATCSLSNKSKSRRMYEISWAFVVRLYLQTSDLEVKKRIIEKWDAHLSDKAAPIYIMRKHMFSLRYWGGHDFITPKLKELFLQTKDMEELCAGFMIFDQYGEKEDIPTLKEKLGAISATDFNNDIKKLAFVQYAIKDSILNIERGPVGSPARTAIGPAEISSPERETNFIPGLPKL